ncbi:MAG: DNA polymerase III subunit alpha [Alphaproteobacteria bacterium]|nr:DNA polymerase III subunit alpha [Alphaproteobacteria bacterium]
MTAPSFIHLRTHSAYSLAEGAIKVVEDKPKDGSATPRKDLIKLCLKHDMPAVALTDKGNLFGALEFGQAAAGAGVQPIVGCQIAVLRPEQASLKTMTRDGYDQLVLLVQNERGYRNLSALVTLSYVEKDRPYPFVTADELAHYTEGLIALSGGIEGEIGRLLLAGQAVPAQEAVGKYAALFPNRFYIEITRHPGGAIGSHEQRIESALIDLAYRHDVPLVATNDVYFGEADMYDAHDALLCIADKMVIAETNRRHLTRDHYFKSAAEMRALFADLPEACDNTLVVARRCAFMPPVRKPILPTFSTEAGRDEPEELRAQAIAGLKARLVAADITDRKPYEDRLAFELDTIIKMGFSGYFLIVSDFIKWSKQNGVAVGPGRGSGAGSLVAWSLLITDLDPLRFGLLFERFLNPERVSMPDFDIDFCQERRDETIRYVQGKYGADRVAQIITFGKLQARAALRDVGRVLAMPYGYVDKICKLVPNNPANPVTLGQAIEGEPQLQQMRDNDPVVAQMMDIALKLEGLLRNASTHAAGLVIGDRPLVELVPLYRDPDSALPATQFNMKTVEATGLVKFDFLGLKTLDVLQMAVELIAARGTEIDLSHIPLDDPKTFTMLAKGDTTGVFQLESSGMRDVLRKLKPNRFEDIIALVALYRPGPMDNIPTYIKCKNGEEKVTYLHDALKPILEDTFGILIYQEQVMQAAQILAGYSLGAADLLRRAMGKKKVSEMAAQRATFIKGAGEKHQVPENQAGMIFDQIDKFAGYGFNKSHAAAYALVAYQTAYLKANHPVEFFAAAMNFELGDTDKLNVFRQELTRSRITLLPPDINHSFPSFAVEDCGGKAAIRYALAAIKGVGMAAMQGVVEARKNGYFRDLFDLAERVDAHAVNRKQMENLAAAGAFDSLNKNRAQVIVAIDTLLKHSQQTNAERSSGQANMFADALGAARPPLPQAKNWDDLTRLQHEFAALGFYMSAHPLDNYRAILERLGAVQVNRIAERQRAGGPNRFKLAGIVVSKQERTSKQGNKFAFVQLSDGSGAFEITVFSELLAAKRDVMEAGKSVLVEVDAQTNTQGGGKQGEGASDLRFIARNIEPLAEAAAKAARGIRIKLYEPSPVADIQKLLVATPKGRAHVTLALALDDGEEAEVELPGAWHLTEAVKASLRQIGDGVDVAEY